MTVCIESYKGNGNYCEIEITEGYTNIVYVVSVCPIIDDLLVGYPIKKQHTRLAKRKRQWQHIEDISKPIAKKQLRNKYME